MKREPERLVRTSGYLFQSPGLLETRSRIGRLLAPLPGLHGLSFVTASASGVVETLPSQEK